MKKEDLEFLERLPSEKLYEFVTEKDFSERKHAALHILEMRRNEPLRRAAESSAAAAHSSSKTAVWAMIAAVVSALAAVISLFGRRP